MTPGQLLLDPCSPGDTHCISPGLVIDQIDEEPSELSDVVRRRVDARLGGGHACFPQIEGDDGQSEGHVLHRLVHRRQIIQRVLGIWRNTDIGRDERIAATSPHQGFGR